MIFFAITFWVLKVSAFLKKFNLVKRGKIIFLWTSIYYENYMRPNNFFLSFPYNGVKKSAQPATADLEKLFQLFEKKRKIPLKFFFFFRLTGLSEFTKVTLNFYPLVLWSLMFFITLTE